MKQKLLNSIQELIRAAAQLKQPDTVAFIEEAAQMLAEAFQRGNQVIIAGNGGSLCDASTLLRS